jgi:hypothetical protein
MKPMLLPGMTRRLTYKVNKTIRFLPPKSPHVPDMPKLFATSLMPSNWFTTQVAAQAKTARQEIV